MLVRNYVRIIENGMPVPDGTEVRFYSYATSGLLATTTTFSGEYEYNFQGNPGPYWVEVEYAGETHLSSSKVVGMSGATNIGGIPLLFNLFDDGFIPGLLEELAVTATGVGMAVSVAGGAAVVAGILYDQSAPLPLTIDPAESQPRIDSIVLQVVPAGANDDTEGRAQIVVKRGIAASSPAAPSLTQTADLWEMPLADVRIDTGVSSIASNKVTDRRKQAHTRIGPSYITTAMIANDAVDNTKILDETIVAANIKANAVSEVKLDAAVRTKLNASSQMVTSEVQFAAYGERASVNYAEVASTSVTIGPGTWKVKTSADLDVFGTGAAGTEAGTFAVRIMNESDEVFKRNYRSSPRIYRPLYISTTEEYTTSANWTIDVSLQVAHVQDGGSVTNFRDGYLYVEAWRV